jgi:putative phosphoribosyl transferase
MYFFDRIDAAEQLVPLLVKYKNQNCVVLAVPRGGVPMGFHIAQKLGFPLDLLMTKKIGHPNNPEYAIGAVSLEGTLRDKEQDVSEDYIQYETQRIRKQLQNRYQRFMPDKKPLELTHKIVIVVDDGIATGYTILAAIELLRKKKPAKIVVAVPVAPPDSANKVRKQVDDFICLYTPVSFYGVGRFYENFEEVTDDKVIQLLKQMDTQKTKT